MERRLGRGLGSLLGTPTSEETPAAPTATLPIDKIRPNAEQPRRVFDPAGLEELRDSILQHGVLQPVVVRPIEGGYELIAGERRWRCARLAGLKEIPAIVREVGDQERLELALVENVQRRDLDAMEKARGYKRMQDSLGLTQEQVAKKVGLKRATVANLLRLLELPGEVQQAVSEGLITMGHARALLALPSPEEQKTVLGRIVRDGLSVRGVEDLARAKVVGAASAPASSGDAEATAEVEESADELTKEILPQAPWLRDLQRRMQIHLGTKVSIANREGYKGKIVVDYYNREHLERLIALLAPQESL